MHLYVIFIALILSLCSPALHANAAAVEAIKNKQRQDTTSVVVGGMVNDGFVEVEHFYRQGPYFRLCPPGNNITLTQGKCVETGAFSGKQTEDYAPQDYLNRLFGEDIVRFVGVGFYHPPSASQIPTSRHKRLVLFYQLIALQTE